MAQRSQETTDLFQESVDSLAGFPVLKILKAIADKIVHINNVQEAF